MPATIDDAATQIEIEQALAWHRGSISAVMRATGHEYATVYAVLEIQRRRLLPPLVDAQGRAYPQIPLPLDTLKSRANNARRESAGNLPPCPDPAELLSAEQAAEILGITRPAVSEWRRNGYLAPARTRGKRGAYLFVRADVEQLRAELRESGRTRPGREGPATIDDAATQIEIEQALAWHRGSISVVMRATGHEYATVYAVLEIQRRRCNRDVAAGLVAS